MKRAKNYKKIADVVLKSKDLRSYLEAACANNPYKFDQAIEMKIAIKRSNKNPQPYKISVTYPHQFGEAVRVLVLAEDADAKAALAAGADYAGLEDYVTKISDEGWFDFDVVIATPAVMPKIAKLGRVLGTKGMMPNPKTGTVVTDVTAAVTDFKAGKKNFKEDKSGVMNTVVAKCSQGADAASANIKALFDAIRETAPNLLNELNSIHIKTTMGPSLKLSMGEIASL